MFGLLLTLALLPLRISQTVTLTFLRATGLNKPLWNLFLHILTNYRSMLVVFVVLPMSFVFDILWRARSWYIAKVQSAPHKHPERVKAIQAQVRQWNDEGRKTKMCTARPGWLNVSPRHATYKKVLFTVDCALHDILDLDTEKQVLRVEPSVNILQILDYLLPRGYTLPVIPELDELTIGGLINGYGIETSSHKYGLFDALAVAFELVLPDASVVRVTKEDKLFHAIPWSFGTIGFLTAVELKVIPAAKYVRHKYIPVYTKEEAVELWTKLQTAANPPEFLEGIMYTEDTGVILAADFENEVKPGDTVNNINWWYKPYFYMHCKSFLDSKRAGEELIPLRQYYQRHNRSIFWALQDQIPVCHNNLFRFALGWLLPPRVPLLKLIESDSVTKFYEENYVLQDFLVPIENLLETIKVCHKEVAVYPLWLCPHRVYNTGKWQGKLRAPKGTSKAGEFVHYVDCAAVGPPQARPFNMVKAITAVETYLRKVGGYQGNYSYTYQTREEYRQMFDHRLYDEVRKELGADVAFPESFDKVARKNSWKKE